MKDIVRPALAGVGLTVLILVAVACASDVKPVEDGGGAVEQNVAATATPNPTATVDARPAPTATPAPTPTAQPTSTPTAQPTPTSTSGRSFTLGAERNPNRFTWISGANADGTVPPDPTNINLWPLVIRAGEAVLFTFTGIGGTHRVGFYPPTNPDGCLAGFCDDDLFTFDDLEPGGTALLTFTWPTAGEVVYLICNEHSGIMRTTIKVIP